MDRGVGFQVGPAASSERRAPALSLRAVVGDDKRDGSRPMFTVIKGFGAGDRASLPEVLRIEVHKQRARHPLRHSNGSSRTKTLRMPGGGASSSRGSSG